MTTAVLAPPAPVAPPVAPTAPPARRMDPELKRRWLETLERVPQCGGFFRTRIEGVDHYCVTGALFLAAGVTWTGPWNLGGRGMLGAESFMPMEDYHTTHPFGIPARLWNRLVALNNSGTTFPELAKIIEREC